MCGGDKIVYAADVSTIKIHLNSTISTKDANKYMTMDVVDFYLNNFLPTLEYMRIPVWAIPKIIMDNYNLWYNLWPLVHNGFVTCIIRKGMYGLLQAGILLLMISSCIGTVWIHPAPHTPGLWCHKTRPTTFTLVVDDFGVKYMSLDDVNHRLVAALKDKYKIKEDWTGSLYTGLTIDWDYDNGTVDISMPGYYAKAALKRFQHATHLLFQKTRLMHGILTRFTRE
jgi:hypothetical protein